MKAYDFNGLTPDVQSALHDKARKSLPVGSSVFDNNFVPEYPNYPLEWVVHRGNTFYYVNTEGYDYARYGFRIKNAPFG